MYAMTCDTHRRLFFIVATVALAAGLGLVGCTHATDSPDVTKAEAAQQIKEGEAGGDLCAQNGWYGDGECDDFCRKADEDCSDDESNAGEDETAYDPCGSKSCGERCTVCPPGDTDCVETAAIKYCTADGECRSGSPQCDAPKTYDPCGSKSCGERCTVCPPDDQDCVETAAVKYCTADGECRSGSPQCDAPEDYDPCGSKTCGERCTVCPPGDNDCAETDVLKYCGPQGSCTAQQPTCH